MSTVGDTEFLPTSESKVMFHHEQVKYLEKMFPERVHTPKNTPEEMYYYAGVRAVVAFIRERQK